MAADGGVFAFGDAGLYGSVGRAASQCAGSSASRPRLTDTATGWSAADGGVFAYGEAVFSGSLANTRINAPITSIAATSDGRGYWLAGADGGVYAFGTAGFAGSLGASGSPNAVVGIAATPSGYAVIDRTGLVTVFSTNGSEAPRNTLYPGERLNPGEALTSPNGRYTLVMQSDGNLVEFDADIPVWASNTRIPGSDFEAQAVGNFVVYAPGHIAVWASGTSHPDIVMILQDDRNIVIYTPGNVAVWTSNTAI